MKRIATPMLVFALLGMSVTTLSGQTGEPVTRTFNAPLERVWTVTESVLKSLGWDIDERDRAVGWILTDSRGVEFKDFGVYGEGTRHKLRIASAGGTRAMRNVACVAARAPRISEKRTAPARRRGEKRKSCWP